MTQPVSIVCHNSATTKGLTIGRDVDVWSIVLIWTEWIFVFQKFKSIDQQYKLMGYLFKPWVTLK